MRTLEIVSKYKRKDAVRYEKKEIKQALRNGKRSGRDDFV